MNYGSVCSGIEAASVAWEPLGWRPQWFSEIEKFPSAVLACHWPSTPNLGDMTKIAAAVRAGTVSAPDLMVGGTPCQAFSVAGLRAGLADPRGQLTLAYVDLLDTIDEKRTAAGQPPAICVWENVPGVLNTKDNAFGCFLAGLAGESRELESPGRKWANAGYVLGPKRAVAWRVLDAQFFGVAQRRRRVFVVASARTDIDPAKILFESESLRRDTAPRRCAGAKATGVTTGRAGVGSHWDNPLNPHPTLNQSHNIGGIGQSNQELFSQRGCGIISMAHGQSGAEIKTDNSAPTLTCNHEAPIAAYSLQHGQIGRKDTAGPQGKGWQEEVGFTLDSRSAADAVATAMSVRRLTPVECERLQGFPDNHTLIPTEKRKQITAEEYAYLRHYHPETTAEQAYRLAADGPRYKAIGNSMAVPVMHWIGKRINDQLSGGVACHAQ